MIDGKGDRKNTGKPSFKSIPPEFLLALAQHATLGTIKYPDTDTGQPNWTRGMKWSIMIDCVFRHFLKWLMGERNDEELGTHHLIAVAWNVMCLFYYDTYFDYKDLDDRPYRTGLERES